MKNAYPFLVVLVVVAVMLLGATAISAKAVCAPRMVIVDRLESEYKEKQSAIGLTGNSNIVELFVSKSGSWTILLSQPNRISCVMAAGMNWETIRIPLNGASL